MTSEEAKKNLEAFIEFYNKRPKEDDRKFKMIQVDSIDIKSIETVLGELQKEKNGFKEFSKAENKAINLLKNFTINCI